MSNRNSSSKSPQRRHNEDGNERNYRDQHDGYRGRGRGGDAAVRYDNPRGRGGNAQVHRDDIRVRGGYAYVRRDGARGRGRGDDGHRGQGGHEMDPNSVQTSANVNETQSRLQRFEVDSGNGKSIEGPLFTLNYSDKVGMPSVDVITDLVLKISALLLGRYFAEKWLDYDSYMEQQHNLHPELSWCTQVLLNGMKAAKIPANDERFAFLEYLGKKKDVKFTFVFPRDMEMMIREEEIFTTNSNRRKSPAYGGSMTNFKIIIMELMRSFMLHSCRIDKYSGRAGNMLDLEDVLKIASDTSHVSYDYHVIITNSHNYMSISPVSIKDDEYYRVPPMITTHQLVMYARYGFFKYLNATTQIKHLVGKRPSDMASSCVAEDHTLDITLESMDNVALLSWLYTSAWPLNGIVDKSHPPLFESIANNLTRLTATMLSSGMKFESDVVTPSDLFSNRELANLEKQRIDEIFKYLSDGGSANYKEIMSTRTKTAPEAMHYRFGSGILRHIATIFHVGASEANRASAEAHRELLLKAIKPGAVRSISKIVNDFTKGPTLTESQQRELKLLAVRINFLGSSDVVQTTTFGAENAKKEATNLTSLLRLQHKYIRYLKHKQTQPADSNIELSGLLVEAKKLFSDIDTEEKLRERLKLDDDSTIVDGATFMDKFVDDVKEMEKALPKPVTRFAVDGDIDGAISTLRDALESGDDSVPNAHLIYAVEHVFSTLIKSASEFIEIDYRLEGRGAIGALIKAVDILASISENVKLRIPSLTNAVLAIQTLHSPRDE